MPLQSTDDDAIQSYMRHFFRVYLSVADDLAIVFKGSIYRKYHKDEMIQLYREKYGSTAGDGSVCLHDRGRDGNKIYKTAEDKFLRCSVDGFDYEYCALRKRKYLSKFDDVSLLFNKFSSILCVFEILEWNKL